MAVRCDAASGRDWPADGLQRLRGNGEGALRFGLYLPLPPNDVGGCRPAGNDRVDARRLSLLQACRLRLLTAGNHDGAVGRRLLSRSFAQHASLDPLQRTVLLSAFRVGETSPDSLSCVLPREAKPRCSGLAQNSTARRLAECALLVADRERA